MIADKKLEAEIDALLAGDNSESVIDALLSMPRETRADGADQTWERILHARLQERLARRMREMLEENEGRKGSRSAA